MNDDPQLLFPAGLSDAAAAALCDFLHELAAAADTRYLARTQEQLEAAFQFDDPEFMAVLAIDSRDRVLGLALFGAVAGARRCRRLHALLGDDASLAALADGVAHLCAESGERLVVGELPDETLFLPALAALERSGFVEEGRVDDFVCDGVALRLMVWRP